MVGTDDGFWFSFDNRASPIAYTFHQWGIEIEVGEAETADEIWGRFDAMVASRRGQIH